jgi:hypothetical protein
MVRGLQSFLIYYSLIELHYILHTFALPFGLFSQPDLMLVRGDAVMAAAFDHVIACCSNYRLGA